MLAAVRDTTDRTLRVDANEGWTLETAGERLEWLAKLGVEFVEQPLPADRIEETRALRRRSPLPFVADESVHTAADIPRPSIGVRSSTGRLGGSGWNVCFPVARSRSIIPLPGSFAAFSSASSPQGLVLVYSSEPE